MRLRILLYIIRRSRIKACYEEIFSMKMNRWKKQITPRATRRLFLEPLEVRTMPSGLTVFGTDGSKHETTVKEESLGTLVQGISQNELIQVKPSGISGGASINWTLAYASVYG